MIKWLKGQKKKENGDEETHLVLNEMMGCTRTVTREFLGQFREMDHLGDEMKKRWIIEKRVYCGMLNKWIKKI